LSSGQKYFQKKPFGFLVALRGQFFLLFPEKILNKNKSNIKFATIIRHVSL